MCQGRGVVLKTSHFSMRVDGAGCVRGRVCVCVCTFVCVGGWTVSPPFVIKSSKCS